MKSTQLVEIIAAHYLGKFWGGLKGRWGRGGREIKGARCVGVCVCVCVCVFVCCTDYILKQAAERSESLVWDQANRFSSFSLINVGIGAFFLEGNYMWLQQDAHVEEGSRHAQHMHYTNDV